MKIDVDQLRRDLVESMSVGRPKGSNIITFTVKEFADSTGRSEDSARSVLKRFVKQGVAREREIVENGASKHVFIFDALSLAEVVYGNEEEENRLK